MILLYPANFTIRTFNSLWQSNAIWRHITGSTLTAPNHYLRQMWLTINLWTMLKMYFLWKERLTRTKHLLSYRLFHKHTVLYIWIICRQILAIIYSADIQTQSVFSNDLHNPLVCKQEYLAWHSKPVVNRIWMSSVTPDVNTLRVAHTQATLALQQWQMCFHEMIYFECRKIIVIVSWFGFKKWCLGLSFTFA